MFVHVPTRALHGGASCIWEGGWGWGGGVGRGVGVGAGVEVGRGG